MEMITVAGIQIPANLADPSLSHADLVAVNARIAARVDELRPTGTGAFGEIRELIAASETVATEAGARIEMAGASVATVPEAPVPLIVTAPEVGIGAAAVIVGGDATEMTEEDLAADAELVRVASAALARPEVYAHGGQVNVAAVVERPRAAITASAGASTIPVGSVVDVTQMGSSFFSAGNSVLTAAKQNVAIGDGGKVRVASVQGFDQIDGFDARLILSDQRPVGENTRLIESTLSARLELARGNAPAQLAAAPWCEPFDVIRQLPDNFDASTPLRNGIPFVPAGHGGFTFNAPYTLSEVDAGLAVNNWSSADQAAVLEADPTTWKKCYTVVCGTPTKVSCDDYITACIKWHVGNDVNNPERIAQLMRIVNTLRGRRTEQRLGAAIDQLSHKIGEYPTVVSAVPDFISNVLAALSHASYDERLSDLNSYALIMDTGVLDVMVVDENRKAYGMERSRAQIVEHVMAELPIVSMIQMRDRVPGAYGVVAANGNVYASAHLGAPIGIAGNGPDADPTIPEAAPTYIAPFAQPKKFRIRLVPLNEIFAWSSGEIGTGVMQDFAMARRNEVGWFAEEKLCLTKYGTSPWFALDMILCPTGFRSGWTTSGLACA